METYPRRVPRKYCAVCTHIHTDTHKHTGKHTLTPLVTTYTRSPRDGPQGSRAKVPLQAKCPGRGAHPRPEAGPPGRSPETLARASRRLGLPASAPLLGPGKKQDSRSRGQEASHLLAALAVPAFSLCHCPLATCR